jgi:hypothetical protein
MTNEKEIVWLEDISKLPYVREFEFISGSRTRPPRKKHGEARLVGYATLDKSARSSNGVFVRRMFLLKTYDRDSDPESTYKTGCPVEGVDPMTVKPGVRGIITDRAWGKKREAA